MANPIKGEASLEIEGVGSFTLALPFGSRVAAEERTGLPFHEIASRAGRGFESAILTIVWASLQKYHPEVTIEQVTDWLENHMEEFMDAASAAAERSDPVGNGTKATAKAKPKSQPRGKNSGRSGVKRG